MFNIPEVCVAVLLIFLPFLLALIHAKAKGKKFNELLLNYYLFISVGIQGIHSGLVEILSPDIVVFYTKWNYSRFLLELGMANVSFGILGTLCFWCSDGWKKATACGYGLFLFMTGVGHLVNIAQHGPSPGDLGGFLFSDLLVPCALFYAVSVNRKTQTKEI